MRWRALLLGLPAAAAAAARPAWPTSCQSTEEVSDLLKDINLDGKVIVTTGADGNIASQLNLGLARAGATVVLACRSTAKCNATRSMILEQSGVPAERVEMLALDLSSLSSIRAFAAQVLARHPQLHALVNSAGLGANTGGHLTADGFNMLMEVNVLGPVLLTELLLPALRGGASRAAGRVVNVAADVASVLLKPTVEVKDLIKAFTSTNSSLADFQTSKFLLAQHAVELAKREPSVAAFAVNPNYAIEAPGMSQRVLSFLLRLPLFGWDWFVRRVVPASSAPFVERGHAYCTTTMRHLKLCPATYAGAAAVVAAAVAAPGVEAYSGSWLDYETVAAPTAEDPEAHQLLEPSCQPRPGPRLGGRFRTEWYDQMMTLILKDGASGGPAEAPRLVV